MTNENMNTTAMVEYVETAPVTEMGRLIDAANGGSNSFLTSIKDDGTRESKIAIYNAINNSDKKVDDYKGKVLEIVNFAAHPIKLISDETGEVNEVLRIVLIDKDGNGYETVAGGVMSSLEKIFGIVGMAPWEPALKVVPTEVKTRKGFKTLTLSLA